MQPIPEDAVKNLNDDETETDPNTRMSIRDSDKMIEDDREYYDGADGKDGVEGGRDESSAAATRSVSPEAKKPKLHQPEEAPKEQEKEEQKQEEATETADA